MNGLEDGVVFMQGDREDSFRQVAHDDPLPHQLFFNSFNPFI